MKFYLPESAAKELGCSRRNLHRLAVAIGKTKSATYNALPVFSEKDLKAMRAKQGRK